MECAQVVPSTPELYITLRRVYYCQYVYRLPVRTILILSDNVMNTTVRRSQAQLIEVVGC